MRLFSVDIRTLSETDVIFETCIGLCEMGDNGSIAWSSFGSFIPPPANFARHTCVRPNFVHANTMTKTNRTKIPININFLSSIGCARTLYCMQSSSASSARSAQWSQPSHIYLLSMHTLLLGHWKSCGLLQQLASSWPSEQWVVPSQTKLFSIHSPDWQRNCSGLHDGHPTSSDLSGP